VRDAIILKHLSDRRWRLNNLYWITDKHGKCVRFRLNAAQAELMAGLHKLNLILKARQLGFTTFIQLYILDACVFMPNTHAGVIAHTKDDAEAIFREKIKFPYDNLPDAVKRVRPVIRDNTTTLELGNGSIIKVGTSMRSGTLQMLHVSEFGKICAKYPEKAREIITGALNTVEAGQFACIESTAEGQEGRFYELCQEAQTKQRLGAKLGPLDWKFHFFPWWRDPGYALDPNEVDIPPELERYFRELRASEAIKLTEAQMAWYAKKWETQKADMKREYPSTPREAFESAVEGAYYADPLAKAEEDGRVGRVPYEPNLRVETWWDLGMDDDMAIWFVQRFRKELRVIDYYANSGEGLAHYAKVLSEKPYVYSRHVGPHDLAVREMGTGKSRQEVAIGLGLRPWVIAPRLEVIDGIEAVRNLLSGCWFDAAKCAEGLKALRSYRKDWDENRGVWLSKPRHDWASHGADAFRTGASAPPPETFGGGKIILPDSGAV
jgi:hypothetical protein